MTKQAPSRHPGRSPQDGAPGPTVIRSWNAKRKVCLELRIGPNAVVTAEGSGKTWTLHVNTVVMVIETRDGPASLRPSRKRIASFPDTRIRGLAELRKLLTSDPAALERHFLDRLAEALLPMPRTARRGDFETFERRLQAIADLGQADIRIACATRKVLEPRLLALRDPTKLVGLHPHSEPINEAVDELLALHEPFAEEVYCTTTGILSTPPLVVVARPQLNPSGHTRLEAIEVLEGFYADLAAFRGFDAEEGQRRLKAFLDALPSS